MSLTVTLHQSFICIHAMMYSNEKNNHLNIFGLSSNTLNVCLCTMSKCGFYLSLTLMSKYLDINKINKQ